MVGHGALGVSWLNNIINRYEQHQLSAEREQYFAELAQTSLQNRRNLNKITTSALNNILRNTVKI